MENRVLVHQFARVLNREQVLATSEDSRQTKEWNFTSEHKRKLRESSRKRWDNATPEQRKKWSAAVSEGQKKRWREIYKAMGVSDAGR